MELELGTAGKKWGKCRHPDGLTKEEETVGLSQKPQGSVSVGNPHSWGAVEREES